MYEDRWGEEGEDLPPLSTTLSWGTLSTTFYLSVGSSALIILITIWPLAFWLVIGKFVKKDMSVFEALSVPIFPLTKEQVEERARNYERIKFMEYNTETEAKGR